jgi:hypothetical protein
VIITADGEVPDILIAMRSLQERLERGGLVMSARTVRLAIAEIERLRQEAGQ